jgi:hypothetical protein
MTREATPWAQLQCRCFCQLRSGFQERTGSYFNIVIESCNAICFAKMNAKVMALRLVIRKSAAHAECRSAWRSARQQVSTFARALVLLLFGTMAASRRCLTTHPQN